MLQIISVYDLVTVYLKLYLDPYIFIHFQASECSWRHAVPALQVMNVFLGEEGKGTTLKTLLSVDIAF